MTGSPSDALPVLTVAALRRNRRRSLLLAAVGALAALAGLVGYGAASNHPGGAYSGPAKAWQVLGVAGLLSVLPGVMGVLNARYISTWVMARPSVPVDVTADARGELRVALGGEPPVRMQAWTVIWKVRRLEGAGPIWFAGDIDRGGAIGTSDQTNLIAITTVKHAFRPGRRPRP